MCRRPIVGRHGCFSHSRFAAARRKAAGRELKASGGEGTRHRKRAPASQFRTRAALCATTRARPPSSLLDITVFETPPQQRKVLCLLASASPTRGEVQSGQVYGYPRWKWPRPGCNLSAWDMSPGPHPDRASLRAVWNISSNQWLPDRVAAGELPAGCARARSGATTQIRPSSSYRRS